MFNGGESPDVPSSLNSTQQEMKSLPFFADQRTKASMAPPTLTTKTMATTEFSEANMWADSDDSDLIDEPEEQTQPKAVPT